jgi:hypothetical protein
MRHPFFSIGLLLSLSCRPLRDATAYTAKASDMTSPPHNTREDLVYFHLS